MQEFIYIYKGKNTYLNQLEINKKVSTFDIDPFNINRYDLIENTSNDVLEELQTISLFSDRKIVIVKHIEEIENLSDKAFTMWEKYFKNPNPDVVLLIDLNTSYDISKRVADLIYSYGYTIEVEDIEKDKYPDFVLSLLQEDGYDMDKNAILMLLERTNYEFNLLTQELTKLKIYKIDTKKINESDVLSLVPKNLEDNIFELTNAMIANQSARMIEIYEDLMRQNEDPLRILNFIANKLRELFHARLLLNKGYGKAEIAQHFNYSSGRTYYLMKNASSMSVEQIEKQLKKLTQLDYEIKSGLKHKKLGLELFLLGA